MTTHSLSEDSVWRTAALIHFSALVGLLGNGIGFLVAPLVIWFVKRDDDPILDEHGKEAVNFQITMMATLLVMVPLVFVGIGVIGLIAVGVLMVVLPVVAGVKALNGEDFRYPLTHRFIK